MPSVRFPGAAGAAPMPCTVQRTRSASPVIPRPSRRHAQSAYGSGRGCLQSGKLQSIGSSTSVTSSVPSGVSLSRSRDWVQLPVCSSLTGTTAAPVTRIARSAPIAFRGPS